MMFCAPTRQQRYVAYQQKVVRDAPPSEEAPFEPLLDELEDLRSLQDCMDPHEVTRNLSAILSRHSMVLAEEDMHVSTALVAVREKRRGCATGG